MCATEFASTETSTIAVDGHDYILRYTHHDRRCVVSCADTQEPVGHIETSPCGEYFIVENYDNPLGMSEHHHINSVGFVDLAYSMLAGQ